MKSQTIVLPLAIAACVLLLAVSLAAIFLDDDGSPILLLPCRERW